MTTRTLVFLRLLIAVAFTIQANAVFSQKRDTLFLIGGAKIIGRIIVEADSAVTIEVPRYETFRTMNIRRGQIIRASNNPEPTTVKDKERIEKIVSRNEPRVAPAMGLILESTLTGKFSTNDAVKHLIIPAGYDEWGNYSQGTNKLTGREVYLDEMSIISQSIGAFFDYHLSRRFLINVSPSFNFSMVKQSYRQYDPIIAEGTSIQFSQFSARHSTDIASLDIPLNLGFEIGSRSQFIIRSGANLRLCLLSKNRELYNDESKHTKANGSVLNADLLPTGAAPFSLFFNSSIGYRPSFWNQRCLLELVYLKSLTPVSSFPDLELSSLNMRISIRFREEKSPVFEKKPIQAD